MHFHVITFVAFFALALAIQDEPVDPKSVPTIRFSNGVDMPVIGLGTWEPRPGLVEPAIEAAVAAGYRNIDTADLYKNEEAIGNALQSLFNKGIIKREDIFVTTKLNQTGFRKEDVEPFLRDQLRRLKLDYVDLYLMHFPAAYKANGKGEVIEVSTSNLNYSQLLQILKIDETVKPEDTWQGMEGVYNKNLTRSIGISNFNSSQIQRLLKIAKVPIHNLQVECHVHFIQRELLELSKQNNISMTCYAPLGAPGLVKWLHADSPYPWPPGPKPLLNPEVLKLSGKYGKPPASILLRYLIQRGNIVIPKSVQPERIRENIQVFDFKLTDEEMDKLSQSQPQQRIYTQQWMIGHPEDPFASER
ncbi:aldo/keto reductase family domain-containing protein [Ditylenchus destructor]|nr:aldo/keto reductase family domain-containing protein [Ditylenchus destructor]